MSELEQFYETFRLEAEERCNAIEAKLLDLEERDPDAEDWNALFREVHTLKGNASMLGFEGLTAFTHELEEFLSSARGGLVQSTPELIESLLMVLDRLREKSEEVLAGSDELDERDRTLLDSVVRSGKPVEAKDAPQKGGRESVVTEPAPGPGSAQPNEETLRVRVSTVGSLMDLVGEISIARRRFSRLLATHSGAVRETNETLDGLFQELQSVVMGLRLVPIAGLFDGFRRLTRDLSRSLGKQIQLVTSGEETGLDTSLVEKLRDPLTHLVRNAADHGIESAEEREKLGKPPVGTIELRARQEASVVVVEVIDDGRGIDTAKVTRLAIDRGLTDEESVAEMTEDEKRLLIFEPGFSTASEVTDVSGRGVGMDSVRADLEKIRGTLVVSSVPGEGTTVQLRFPLTVSLIEALEVRVAEEHYVIPLDRVLECVPLGTMKGRRRRQDVYSLRGAAVPFLRLTEWLELGTSREEEELIVLRHGNETFGVCVDEIVDTGQYVVKPLGALGRSSGFSGSTVLDTGRVGLILDTDQLFVRARG